MTECVIRPAQAGDYVDVLKIGKNIYGGFDYLPKMFFWMLHTTDNHPFVATIGDEVVGFNNYRVINDGTTVITMASRVSDTHQGKGINEKMKNDINAIMRQKFPSVKNRIWTSLRSAGQDRYFDKNPGKFTQLCIFPSLRYELALVNTQNFSLIYNKSSSKESDSRETTRFLSYSETLTLLPQIKQLIGSLSSHVIYPSCAIWNAVELTEANLRQAAMECDVIASFQQNNIVSITFTSLRTRNNEESVMAIDFMNYSLEESDVLNHLDISVAKEVSMMSKENDSIRLQLWMYLFGKFDESALVSHLLTYTDDIVHIGSHEGMLTTTDI